MQLSEFVSKTLTEILTGVNEASGKTSMSIANESSCNEKIKNVNFFINVSYTSSNDAGIIVDLESYASNTEHNQTNIKFSVPIVIN